MTRRPSPTTDTAPFGAAIRNRKIQMLLGLFVATTLAASAALATQAAEPAITSRAQIEEIVRDYILEHPEILPQAMERLQAKRIGTVIDSKRDEIETPFAGAWEGAQNGDIVLVEFFDYACGYCRAALPELTAALDGRDDVAVVLKEFPILGPASEQAARLALAIRAEHGDEAYLGFHNALLAQNGALNQASLEVVVGAAGFDFQALERRGQQEDITVRIETNKSLARALGVSGTPAFVFEDELVPGLMMRERLEAAFDRKMKEKAAE